MMNKICNFCGTINDAHHSAACVDEQRKTSVGWHPSHAQAINEKWACSPRDNQMKHTKDPWQVLQAEPDKDYLRIRGTVLGGRYKIANVHKIKVPHTNEIIQQREDAESEANARLMAAAPQLLEALEKAKAAARYPLWLAVEIGKAIKAAKGENHEPM